MTDTNIILEQCDAIEAAVTNIRAQCETSPTPPQPPGFITIDRPAILTAVEASDVPDINWPDRGYAPDGYVNGYAICYGMMFRNWLMCGGRPDSIIAKIAARSKINDNSGDALWWYNSNFINAGIRNDEDGRRPFRSVFTLMYSLGMRE